MIENRDEPISFDAPGKFGFLQVITPLPTSYWFGAKTCHKYSIALEQWMLLVFFRNWETCHQWRSNILMTTSFRIFHRPMLQDSCHAVKVDMTLIYNLNDQKDSAVLGSVNLGRLCLNLECRLLPKTETVSVASLPTTDTIAMVWRGGLKYFESCLCTSLIQPHIHSRHGTDGVCGLPKIYLSLSNSHPGVHITRLCRWVGQRWKILLNILSQSGCGIRSMSATLVVNGDSRCWLWIFAYRFQA